MSVQHIGQQRSRNKSPIFEGNNSEEEVDVLCENAVYGGSNSVRNMACGRCESSV